MIIAIDPGLTGAIANDKGVVYDMPTIAKGKGKSIVKNEIDGTAVYSILYKFYSEAHAMEEECIVYLEEQVYRKKFNPKTKQEIPQGGSSIFSLGDSFGSVRVIPGILGMRLVRVMPSVWKKKLNVPSDKEVCRAEAIRLFPTSELHLKKHHNRAEALLLAYYGTLQEK